MGVFREGTVTGGESVHLWDGLGTWDGSGSDGGCVPTRGTTVTVTTRDFGISLFTTDSPTYSLTVLGSST